MSNYLEIANSKIFYICGSAIILFIIFQSYLFIRLAFKEGISIGLGKKQMIKAFRVGAVSSILPTIAIIVALITMVPVLGIPIPWVRLSVIGSAPYELMAAGIGAKAMGVNGLGGTGYTSEVFASSVWIMCIGSFWAISIVVFFLKKIKSKYASNSSNADVGWRTILTNAAFLGVFCIFIADPVVKGGLPLFTLLSGAGIMFFLVIIIVKLKVNWLKEFALTLSMLGAMLLSIAAANFIF